MVSISSQIVITGIGAVTPLGNSFDTIGDALQNGHSGIDFYDFGTFSRQQEHAAARVQSVDVETDDNIISSSWRIEKSSRLEQFTVVPSALALADAGIQTSSCTVDQKTVLDLLQASEQNNSKIGSATFLMVAMMFFMQSVGRPLSIEPLKYLAYMARQQQLRPPAPPAVMRSHSAKHGLRLGSWTPASLAGVKSLAQRHLLHFIIFEHCRDEMTIRKKHLVHLIRIVMVL